MFSIKNLILITIVIFLLFNFQTVIGVFMLYFSKLHDVIIRVVKKEEVSDEIKEIIKPYEELLLQNGFVYKSAIEYNNMNSMVSELQHTFYYYNEEKSVHALLATLPYTGALQKVTLEYSTFYESYHIATTYDCFQYNLPKVESITGFDHYHGSYQKSYESHLQDRKLEGEVIRHDALDPDDLVQLMDFQVAESTEVLKNANIIKETNKGLRYTLSTAFVKYVQNVLKGYKFSAKILNQVKNEAAKTETTSRPAFAYKNSEELALAHELNHKPKEQDKESKIRTFIISAVLFVLFFGLIGIPLAILPMLIVILIIHELGHFYAMKFFGYKDTSIFFIPLFGAAAKGEKEHVTAYQEFIVYLAGPVPGMIISIIIGVMMLKDPSLMENALLKEYAIMSFALNYLNLLPIFPLDGGKIVQTLLFSRYPRVQFYFFLVSLLLIIISALLLESVLLGLFAMLLFFAINHNHHTSTLITKVLSQNSDEPLSDKVIKTLVHDPRYKEIPMEKKSSMMKQALKVLNLKKPSFLVMIIGMAVYLALLVPPIWLYFLF